MEMKLSSRFAFIWINKSTDLIGRQRHSWLSGAQAHRLAFRSSGRRPDFQAQRPIKPLSEFSSAVGVSEIDVGSLGIAKDDDRDS
jgi:hypothetical protein